MRSNRRSINYLMLKHSQRGFDRKTFNSQDASEKTPSKQK